MRYDYIVERFSGLDQSADESLISPANSPDALNMDTEDGRLKPAAGFASIISAAVPGSAAIDKLFIFRSSAKDVPIAISGGTIYAYSLSEASWQSVHSYSVTPANAHYCCITAQIGTTDHLIIADGCSRMLKYDGSTLSEFGSSEGCSDIACAYLAMYRSRLFAAGDSEHPNRLYYSQLPGSGRSIEDWGYVEASPSVEGGHVEVGTTGGDPITALAALSNQLLIFKKHSIYRLIGDRPGNFTIERVSSSSAQTPSTATGIYGDVLYYLTSEGLYYFNGVDALPMPDMRKIKTLMASASAAGARMAVVGDRLYFTLRVSGTDRMVEYHLTERRYMQYGGFDVDDIIDYEGKLALIGASRRICLWGRGGSFDGAPVNAYWKTPLTALSDCSSIKSLHALYLRGMGGDVIAETRVGGVSREERVRLPDTPDDVAEVKLENEGRTFRLTLKNAEGGAFTLCGGVQISMNVRKRTE